jgi:nucleoside-diphosphate-sugar epimerase
MVGGFGFIGKHVIEAISQSHSITVFSDPIAVDENRAYSKQSGLRVITGDVTDAAAIKRAFAFGRPDAVIHLAALTGLKKCNENPFLAFSTNVFGTFNVVMESIAARSKLIFISSREVYGEGSAGRTAEDTQLAPNNVYGTTKMLAERLVTWANSKFDLRYTILRLTNVYGPGGQQYNVQAMIKSAMEHGIIPIFGGAQYMNLVYVSDVAEVIRKCLTEARTDGIFNIGSEEDMTVNEIIEKLISQLGLDVTIQNMPMRIGETLNFRPDLKKMKRAFPSFPGTSIKEGLQKTISWYQNTAKGHVKP